MQIFGIYDENNKQLVLNPANNRDPRLFTTEADAKDYLCSITTARNIAWLKVVELEVTVGPARTSKDGPACWNAKPKPTVRILPSRRPASTSYPFVVSLFEGSRFDGALEDFRTMEDAKEWAERNGYQVLEEQ